MRTKLGECLVHSGVVSDVELRAALAEQRRTREPIGDVLVRRGVATEAQIAHALALQRDLPFVGPEALMPDDSVLSLVSRATALEHACLPIACEGDVLTLAMADPLLLGLVQEIERATGYRVKPIVATRTAVTGAAERAYASTRPPRAPGAPATELAAADSNGAVLESVDAVLATIQRLAAAVPADVRIDPTESGGMIRECRDGELRDVARMSQPIYDELRARLRAQSGLGRYERRVPEDGCLVVQSADGRDIRARLYSRPGRPGGERLVVRSGDECERGELSLSAVGLSAVVLETLRAALAFPTGLLLVAGPPRSGVTTLAEAISRERGGCRPVSEVNSPAEVAAVMHDAAGTLVVAAVEAFSAREARGALVERGADPTRLTDLLVAVVSVRLARRLCERCRARTQAADARFVGAEGSGEYASHYTARGCVECDYTGYRGRVGLFEVNPGVTFRPANGGGSALTFLTDGASKVEAGVITEAELTRVVHLSVA